MTPSPSELIAVVVCKSSSVAARFKQGRKTDVLL